MQYLYESQQRFIDEVLTSVALGVCTTLKFSFIGLIFFEIIVPSFVDVPSLDLRIHTDLLVVGLLIETSFASLHLLMSWKL
jgi:hypothetical protein